MASKEHIRRFDLAEDELEAQVQTALAGASVDDSISDLVGAVAPESIVEARILAVETEKGFVLVDIGGKAEGSIPLEEFEDDDAPPAQGDRFEVFYWGDDRRTSMPVVSKSEADRERAWSRVVGVFQPGDVISGEVKKKVKGGLLVAVDGVMVFLPASQIDLRRVHEPADYVAKEIRMKIVKVDEERKNIVVSRRQLLEEERHEKRESLLSEIEEGQVRKGEVKNIADFGAFVDLGGMDGLLHVTDMSYGRVKHPREMLSIGDQLEVFVLSVDRERNRVALSLKALSKNPWEKISERYPVGTVHTGRIANIVPYGLFVALEPGVEGLVHVTEISWTRQNLNPEDEFEKGAEIEVHVRDIDLDKQEMSLSVREVEGNPWDRIAEQYAPGTVLEATIKNHASYGAFVEIEDGIDGLLHNTDFHWTRKVQHPSEVCKKGDRIQCVVLAVDREKQRISLGMKQLSQNPWEDYIPANYHVGDMVAGTITKNISSGSFVELEEGLEAFMHFSTVPEDWHDDPENHCLSGLKVEVRVVRVDCGEERIGLSFLHADYPGNDELIAAFQGKQAKKAARKAAKEAEKAAVAEESEAIEAPAEDAEAAPEEAPAEDADPTPEEAPTEDADAAPEEAPEEAPAEDAEEAPEEASTEDAEEAPEEAPAEDAEEAPEEAPAEDADAAPEEAPEEAPAEEAPAEEADAAPEEAPAEDAEAAPEEVPAEEADAAPEEAPAEDADEKPDESEGS